MHHPLKLKKLSRCTGECLDVCQGRLLLSLSSDYYWQSNSGDMRMDLASQSASHRNLGQPGGCHVHYLGHRTSSAPNMSCSISRPTSFFTCSSRSSRVSSLPSPETSSSLSALSYLWAFSSNLVISQQYLSVKQLLSCPGAPWPLIY